MPKLFLHTLSRPSGIECRTIAAGYDGQIVTLGEVRRIVRASLGYDGHPALQEVKDAYAATLNSMGVDLTDRAALADGLFMLCKAMFRFVPDVGDGDEHLQTPARTAMLGTGDCEDATAYVATIFGLFGFPVRLAVIQYTPEATAYEHILPLVGVDGVWLPADITPKAAWLGKDLPALRYATLDINDGATVQLSGFWDKLGKVLKTAVPLGISGGLAIYGAKNDAKAQRDAQALALAQAQAQAAQAQAVATIQPQTSVNGLNLSLDNPLVLIGGGLAAYLVLKK